MFVLEIEPKKDGNAWLEPMLFDSAYLHAICFTIQAYFRNQGTREWRSYDKAIRIVQERLKTDERCSDSTIMTIMALTGHASMTGDHTSAMNHIRGMLKLVKMRGVGTITNTKLLIEIIRGDLNLAIENGSPVLDISFPLAKGNVLGLNSRLAEVWIAMSEFCSNVTILTEQDFLQKLFVMYRLLEPCEGRDESFRLGLLSFLSPIFLQWSGRRSRIPCSIEGATPRESLWLLMVASNAEHKQLREMIELCGIRTWDEMLEVLKSFLWIEVYDKPGKEIFDSVMAQ